jgi:hypothetical protein
MSSPVAADPPHQQLIDGVEVLAVYSRSARSSAPPSLGPTPQNFLA